ncbi:hypothetical protein QZH56_13875 [Streptomyces olivoreticuli]|uniref:hypothetical protein n=1 Tax=Streptomyces olivoreticuli TaxID=68246 RepID=UPI002659D9A6|nr:hypothetical protein [Streptomyces olivoreticuli]WKK26580.1 hypothetical protein QZH56_13875 [Streptomyces olivoreticuli]
MITPQRVTVSPFGRRNAAPSYWLHFDTSTLVDLNHQLGRELAYELAAHLGLDVTPSEPRLRAAYRRVRIFVRRGWSRVRR